MQFQLVDGYQKQSEAARQKVAEAEERLKKANSEKEESTTKLLNLRRNATKLLRVIQEVS